MFFCLDAKEPKNQGKPDPSGRLAGPTPPSAWLFLFFAWPVVYTEA
jgi:hypothetical protein